MPCKAGDSRTGCTASPRSEAAGADGVPRIRSTRCDRCRGSTGTRGRHRTLGPALPIRRPRRFHQTQNPHQEIISHSRPSTRRRANNYVFACAALRNVMRQESDGAIRNLVRSGRPQLAGDLDCPETVDGWWADHGITIEPNPLGQPDLRTRGHTFAVALAAIIPKGPAVVPPMSPSLLIPKCCTAEGDRPVLVQESRNRLGNTARYRYSRACRPVLRPLSSQSASTRRTFLRRTTSRQVPCKSRFCPKGSQPLATPWPHFGHSHRYPKRVTEMCFRCSDRTQCP
jgi:hypothetical protein